MINWLMDHIFDRAGARRWREEEARHNANMRAITHLNKRIAEAFTPQEWADTEARCRREHPECFK